jgi:hypothetical protein
MRAGRTHDSATCVIDGVARPVESRRRATVIGVIMESFTEVSHDHWERFRQHGGEEGAGRP